MPFLFSKRQVRYRAAGSVPSSLIPVVLGLVVCAASNVHAASLPGPADAGRVPQREEAPFFSPNLAAPAAPTNVLPEQKAPEQSKHVTLVLNAVDIKGMTVFTSDEVKDIYVPYIGREITLDTVWVMAGQLTERYRDKGYFLSRVFVPQQKIDHGVVVLQAVEGYVSEVKLDGPVGDDRIVRQWLDRLRAYRPVKAEQIESVLLRLNDIPGVDLRAVLEPIHGQESADGAVRLVLEPQPVPMVGGTVSFDNNGSRYLGPYEGQLQAQVVEAPGLRTTLNGLLSLPWDEMKYGGVRQEFGLFANAIGEVYGSYTATAPGYTLKAEDIRSASTNLGMAFDYNLVRQRQQNLNARVAFEAQDTETNILGTALTRDYIRALRFGLAYQNLDGWNGQNAFDGTLSQGLPMLGASPSGQANLSRANARPDFTRFNLNASRLQPVFGDWAAYGALAAQMASGPLYSSEQFGYGGQAFGRAYNNSEITGDQGIEGSAELRYSGIALTHHVQPVPYGFYDLGAVWNISDPTDPYASGSSAGAGVRLLSDVGASANLSFAFPLTRPAGAPLEGNGKTARYFFSVAYGF